MSNVLNRGKSYNNLKKISVVIFFIISVMIRKCYCENIYAKDTELLDDCMENEKDKEQSRIKTSSYIYENMFILAKRHMEKIFWTFNAVLVYLVIRNMNAFERDKSITIGINNDNIRVMNIDKKVLNTFFITLIENHDFVNDMRNFDRFIGEKILLLLDAERDYSIELEEEKRIKDLSKKVLEKENKLHRSIQLEERKHVHKYRDMSFESTYKRHKENEFKALWNLYGKDEFKKIRSKILHIINGLVKHMIAKYTFTRTTSSGLMNEEGEKSSYIIFSRDSDREICELFINKNYKDYKRELNKIMVFMKVILSSYNNVVDIDCDLLKMVEELRPFENCYIELLIKIGFMNYLLKEKDNIDSWITKTRRENEPDLDEEEILDDDDTYRKYLMTCIFQRSRRFRSYDGILSKGIADKIKKLVLQIADCNSTHTEINKKAADMIIMCLDEQDDVKVVRNILMKCNERLKLDKNYEKSIENLEWISKFEEYINGTFIEAYIMCFDSANIECMFIIWFAMLFKMKGKEIYRVSDKFDEMSDVILKVIIDMLFINTEDVENIMLTYLNRVIGYMKRRKSFKMAQDLIFYMLIMRIAKYVYGKPVGEKIDPQVYAQHVTIKDLIRHVFNDSEEMSKSINELFSDLEFKVQGKTVKYSESNIDEMEKNGQLNWCFDNTDMKNIVISTSYDHSDNADEILELFLNNTEKKAISDKITSEIPRYLKLYFKKTIINLCSNIASDLKSEMERRGQRRIIDMKKLVRKYEKEKLDRKYMLEKRNEI